MQFPVLDFGLDYSGSLFSALRLIYYMSHMLLCTTLLHSCFDRSSAVKTDSHLTLGQQNPWRTTPNLTYPLQQTKLIRLPQNFLALCPTSPIFLPTVCIQVHKSRRAVKNCEGLGAFIIWMMSSGHVGGEGPKHKKQHTGPSVWALYHSSRLQMLALLANMI